MDIAPWIKRNPNELIRSGDWNEIQIKARHEIYTHKHTGDADGTPIPREGIALNAIDGSRIDPSSHVTVAELKVGARDLLKEIDTLLARAAALESSKVNRSGDTLTGDLTVQGNVHYSGRLSRLDTAEQDAADVRVADFRLGHSKRRGTRHPERPLGRALVDDTDALRLNYDSDWPKVRIDGKEGIFLDGNVGIGTTEPKKMLHIQQGDIGAPVLNQEGRPGLAISGRYPDLTLFSSVANDYHGPVIRLGAYDDETRTKYKGWSIGTAGSNARFLDIGFSANEPNPHAGIRRYDGTAWKGTTVLTCHENGHVGIGMLEPGEHLSIGGLSACIELGAGVEDKEANAGKIAYQRWSDALEIVGGGSNRQRRLKVWAEQGTEFTGNLQYAGQLSKLDTAEQFNADVRAQNLRLGHSMFRGTRSPDQPLGLALTDLTDMLCLNYGSDWPKLRIDGKEGIFLEGNLGIGTKQSKPSAKLSLGMELANTKIALHDDPYDMYGLGIADSQFRLHLGNWRARFSFLNGVEGAEVMTVKGDGNVGIGELEPFARLSVVAASANLPPNEVRSKALLVNAGKLGTSKGSELTLASIGFSGAGNTFLGIRAHRIADGDDWTSTSIGLSLDTDGTPRAGADLYLSRKRSVGIGIEDPQGKLHVNGDVKLSGMSVGIELGVGIPDKHREGGWIAYRWQSDALEIYGGGSKQKRRLKIWAEDGTEFTGPVTIAGEPAGKGGIGVGVWRAGLGMGIELGYGVPEKDEFGGVIAYRWKSDGLDIFGGGSDFRRRLTVWAEAGTEFTGPVKTSQGKLFEIDHPLDPRGQSLRHASLEGPELGVYYRGEARLEDGVARVELPAYFEALVRQEDRTVQLTPKWEGKGPLSSLAASAVEDGRFVVHAMDRNNPTQAFYWEVKGIRADLERLATEVPKGEA